MNEGITELTNIWARVKQELAKSVEDQRFFDVFLEDTSIYSIEGNKMTVIASSGFAVSILSEKYYNIVKQAVKTVYGKELELKFDVKENLKQAAASSSLEEKPTFFKNAATNSSLSFDNFVTGPSNIEAKQAALYIASNPGKSFNPLFIYSNPGLGKTHLLHAIVNYIREKFPGKRALYCEADEFLQEYVNYTTGVKQQDSLREFITGFDVFLIDDIQGLSSKDMTQKFYFEVFNNMYSHGKQIVITSDRHPQDLKGFEERLRSRFASGLTVSINQPEITTCEEILRSKINNSPLEISNFDPQVIEFIAQKFSKNIRDIDQALNKLLFYITTFKPTAYIDMATAAEALQSLIDVKDSRQKVNEQRILNVVADYYNLSTSQLTGQSRQGNVALARHIAMYLIKKLIDLPYTRIGLIFGGKDHSTVMNGVEKVENSLKTNTSLQTAINEIKAQLKS